MFYEGSDEEMFAQVDDNDALYYGEEDSALTSATGLLFKNGEPSSETM